MNADHPGWNFVAEVYRRLKFNRFFSFRNFSFFLMIFSIVGAILVPNPITTTATPPQSIPRPLAYTDLNPLGANFFLDREVEFWKREQTLKMAREAGIGWAKQMFSWEDIEPKKNKFWDDIYKKSTWQKYDEIVSLCEKYGIKLIVRLDRPPEWARRDNTLRTAPPDNFEDYGDFVFEVVKRYKGRVQHFQIWNEPNIWPEWGNQAVDPAGYVKLLKIAYKRAKEADPNVIILSAPLAATLESNERNLSDLDYLEKMYTAGARDYFDILSANAYGFDKPPTDPASPDRLNFSRIILLREIMLNNNDAEKAVWLNEFGWNAAPEAFPPTKLYWGRVTEQQQADYTVEAMELARSWDWVGVIGIWYFRQVGDLLADERSDYYFRIVDVDFTPRLVYHALQRMTEKIKTASPGTHQDTSPAVETKGSWKLIKNDDALGRTLTGSEMPGDTLTFSFLGTKVDLLANRDNHSGMASVRIDGAEPRLLPRDSQGRSYADFFSPSPMSGAVIPIADDLSLGRHTVQITVINEKNSLSSGNLVAIDGFEVSTSSPSFSSFYGILALLGLTTLGFVSSFLLRRKRG